MRRASWQLLSGLLLLATAGCLKPVRELDGPLPALGPESVVARARLERHVRRLAGEIGPRGVFRPAALAAAADYVRGELGAGGDEVRSEPFDVESVRVENLVIERRGRSAADEIVVVGAHYDTVPGSPGADDNASGVAALLEIASRLAGRPHARTLRFVAFVNEESPYFQRAETMGSRRHARASRARGENVVGMISLESIGYYSDRPDSQRYPLGAFAWVFPSHGDFIALVGNVASRELLSEALEGFRAASPLPSGGAAVPASIPGVGWSDHWAFWQEGYPAIMATGTAPFRNPGYHAPEDRPETLDYDRLTHAVDGLAGAVSRMAGATAKRPGRPISPGVRR